MAGVSTIALLERKTSISRDLFSRCWRDVHGIMAARIPGFDSFIQHHVMPMSEVGSTNPEPFEGIAVVTYTSEANRQGLIESDITPHIQPDEQNVFRRALLYNLGEGERRDLFEPSGEGGTGRLFVAVLETVWASNEEALTAIRAVVAASGGTIAAYRTGERYVMVEHGRPTALGFRGLDVLRTIEEAEATNQLDPVVERAVFG